MAINLNLYAKSAISAALESAGKKIEDASFFDDLRESAMDQIGTEADNACIYYADCLDIINRYESEYGADAEDLADSGKEFKASEWQQAMTQYAYGVAHAAISAMVEESIKELEEAYELIRETIPDDSIPVTLETSCIHGWAAHARETSEGVCIWHRLEGEVEARAIQCGGLWLTATWTPEKA